MKIGKMEILGFILIMTGFFVVVDIPLQIYINFTNNGTLNEIIFGSFMAATFFVAMLLGIQKFAALK